MARVSLRLHPALGAGALLALAGWSAGEAPSLAEVLRLLASKVTEERLQGIEQAVHLDNKEAVQAIENAVRRVVSEMNGLAATLDKVDAEHAALIVQIVDMLFKGEDQTAAARYDALVQRAKTVTARLAGHSAKMHGHLEVFSSAREAMTRFRGKEAILPMVAGARGETNPLLRQMYLAGLGHPTRAESLPQLIELTSDKDARVRSGAVRALRPFARQPGVVQALRALEHDAAWQVRLGAYDAIARAPPAVAIPILVLAAAREEGEIAVRVDGWLETLTGRSFRQSPAAWPAWYASHRAAIEDGTFRPSPGDAPVPGETRTVATFFSLPIESTRVLFAVDFSGSMHERMVLADQVTNRIRTEHNLDSTRLGYAQAELIRALRALPDGALFNIIVYCGSARTYAPRLVKASSASRTQAIRWILKPRTDWLTNIYAALELSFQDYAGLSGGATRFLDLPDTIVLLSDGEPTCGRFQDGADLAMLVRMWNEPIDLVIHCVGLGSDHDRALLEALASETGGYYLDLAKGAGDLKRMRRRIAKTNPVSLEESPAYDAILALANGEERQRAQAAEELGGMRDEAAVAIPALAGALGDEEPYVRNAVTAALAKFGSAAVPALVRVLQGQNDVAREAAADVAGQLGPDAAGTVAALLEALEGGGERAAPAAARALGKIGPAARSAIPALEKALDSPDFNLAYAADRALERLR